VSVSGSSGSAINIASRSTTFFPNGRSPISRTTSQLAACQGNRQKQKFGDDGIAEPHDQADRVAEVLFVFGRDQLPVGRLLDHDVNAAMDDQFRPNQQRQRQQESRLNVDIVQEWNSAAQEGSADDRQSGKRKPCDEDARQNSAVEQFDGAAAPSSRAIAIDSADRPAQGRSLAAHLRQLAARSP